MDSVWGLRSQLRFLILELARESHKDNLPFLMSDFPPYLVWNLRIELRNRGKNDQRLCCWFLAQDYFSGFFFSLPIFGGG